MLILVSCGKYSRKSFFWDADIWIGFSVFEIDVVLGLMLLDEVVLKGQRLSLAMYNCILNVGDLRDHRSNAVAMGATGIEPGKFLLCIGRLEPVKFPDDAVRILSAAIKAGRRVWTLLHGITKPAVPGPGIRTDCSRSDQTWPRKS